MLVGDFPRTIDLPQPDRQPEARRAVLEKLLLRAAAQQCGRECDLVAGGHIELCDLKSAVSLLLPIEERWPCLSIGGNPAHSGEAGRRTSLHRQYDARVHRRYSWRGPRRPSPLSSDEWRWCRLLTQ